MDVTQEIQKNHIIYGASDNTAPQHNAAGRSLNYADGPSIQRPVKQEVTVIPFTLKYESAVGLFGAENYFVKVNLNLLGVANDVCYEEPYWLCGYVNFQAQNPDGTYQPGLVDYDPVPEDNTYIEAAITEGALPFFAGRDAYVSVDLNNLKVGNKYIDNWLDVRLYTKDREEHPHDRMFVRARDFFYIGIHARNTRRLPFDVECLIGKDLMEYDAIKEKQLIMRTTAFGSRGPNAYCY